MKTYIIDWNGSYAIVCAKTDDEMVLRSDSALDDPSQASRICQLHSMDVVDIKRDGSIEFCGDEPKWFVFDSKFKRKYLKVLVEE